MLHRAGDFDRITRVLSRQLARYPAGYLAKVNVARVLVCAHVRENGHDIPSLPNIDGAWLIDATLSDAFAARIAHHEIYHFIDLAEDGTLNTDPSWEALNPSSFAYGEGGRSLRSGWASEATDTAPGFVTAYATTAVAEDKAETLRAVDDAPRRGERARFERSGRREEGRGDRASSSRALSPRRASRTDASHILRPNESRRGGRESPNWKSLLRRG